MSEIGQIACQTPDAIQEDFKKIKIKKKISNKVIFITSGKGGVGKTSICLKMAKCLSSEGNRVLLIDADSNLSNTSIKLGLPISDKFSLFLNRKISIDELINKDGNFHLLSTCNGDLDLFGEKFDLNNYYFDVINKSREKYDYILIDGPAGITKSSAELSAYADYRIVVVTPDNSSITDAYAVIKILSTMYSVKHNLILANKVGHKDSFHKIVRALGETAENFLQIRLEFLGYISQLECRVDAFDKLLIEENNSFHMNMVEIVGRLSDQVGIH